MVVVTRKYQVTIPEEVRKGLSIKIGDKVVFVKEASSSYRLMTIEELAKEGCELCRDIKETVREVRKGLARRIRG